MQTSLIQKVVKAIALILWLLAPIQKALLTALALVFLDLITGLLAARKQKIPITSFGLRRTVAKLLAYETAIVIAFAVETNLAAGIPFAHIVGGFIGVTELKSVYENIQILTGVDLTSLVARIQGAAPTPTALTQPVPNTPPTQKIDPPGP